MSRAGNFPGGIVGFDISGWHDRAVRNWRVTSEGIPEAVEDGHLIDAGSLGCTVLVGPENDQKRVAGPAARLAPHGRGDGWGRRGAQELRHSLRAQPDVDDIAATLGELARRPAIGVFAIPDLETTTDEYREMRLSALKRAGVRKGILAWSSVLLSLSYLAEKSLRDGTRIGVVELDGVGLRLQTIEVRARGDDRIPKRRQPGKRLKVPGLGLFERELNARRSIISESSVPRLKTVIDRVDLPGLLALSEPGVRQRDLVRLDNGDWREVDGTAPALVQSDIDLSELAETDVILVHTPGSPGLSRSLAQALVAAAPISIMPPEAAAQGAFIAGKRLRDGLPLWFDYLPQIDTIVMQDSEARNQPLVPGDEEVEAGQPWKSKAPIQLQWPGGAEELRVWLRKDDHDRPRKAPAYAGTAPERAVSVELWVQQSPAQDRARLTISAPGWQPLRDRPAVVDWDSGEPDPRSWEAILEEETGPRPAIPARVILPGDARMWYEEGGLAEALEDFDDENFTPIYQALASRKRLDWDSSDPVLRERRYYAVDSDGKRPNGVTDEDWEALLRVIALAEQRLLSGRVMGNHAFGVLSWIFHLCPETIWPLVPDVLSNGNHPLHFHGASIMYTQGLGRIANTPGAQRAAIDLLSGPLDTWNRDHQACGSFLLSRNDNVFQLLDESTIDHWSRRIPDLLGEQSNNLPSQRYRYLPTLIGGLLRWRLQEPMAFVLGFDDRANAIVDALDLVITKVGRLRQIPTGTRHLKSYEDLRPFFDVEGGSSDILQRLFDRT